MKYTIIVFFLSFFFISFSQCLRNTGNSSGILIGDLDVSGTQITVEALIKLDDLSGDHIVSKYSTASNINYLLKTGSFEISTSTGTFSLTSPAALVANRWYHIAGTYDGSTVRFYIDGCLVNEGMWSGGLVVNDVSTCIGNYSLPPNDNGINGWIDEVRIWSSVRTDIELKQGMLSLLNPFSFPNLLAYYTFQGNAQNTLGSGFNGIPLTSDQYDSVSGDLPTPFILTNTQSYSNILCDGVNTGTIVASTNSPSSSEYSIDGINFNPSNIIDELQQGTYILIVRNENGCQLEEVVVIEEGETFSAGDDVVICQGQDVLLNASGGGSTYHWTTSASLSDTNISNPIASPTVTTTYTVSSKVRVGPNLVVNGDFEMGDFGFSSGYINFSGGNFGDGKYKVINTSPNTVHAGFLHCSDHTTTTGYQLVANGACGVNLAPFANIWCQTINVKPNTDYQFSAWMQNVVNGLASSTLRFTINGQIIGNPVGTSNLGCVWDEFFATWNSGSVTVATICISEGTGTCQGNDLAIDDITFYEICEQVDEVVVIVQQDIFLEVQDIGPLCQNESGALELMGLNGEAPYTFSYSINGGLTSNIISNALGFATLDVNTSQAGLWEYSISIEDGNGCSTILPHTSVVQVNPSPILNGEDALLCVGQSTTLSVTGATDYNWSPSTYIDQVTTSSVVFTAGETIDYQVIGTNEFNCNDTFIINVTVLVNPSIISTPDSQICEGDSIDLTVSGAVSYEWSHGLGTATVVTIAPSVTTTYQVFGEFSPGCLDTNDITITVKPLPQFDVPEDFSICSGDTMQVLLQGTDDAVYNWTVNSSGVNGALQGSGNEILQILETDLDGSSVNYVVYATLDGCSNGPIDFSVQVVPSQFYIDSIWICEYDIPYTWNSFVLQNGGIGVAYDTTYSDLGCEIVRRLDLYVSPSPSTNFQSAAYNCEGVSVPLILNNPPANATCIWEIDGVVIEGDCHNQSITFDSVGCHNLILTVINDQGCMNVLQEQNAFCVVSNPVADFSYDLLSHNSVQTINTSSGASHYEWVTSSTNSDAFEPSFTFYNNLGQFIQLNAINEYGCVSTVLTYIVLGHEILFYVPNAFTPDGDEFNNAFLPVMTYGIDVFNYTFEIFNRWGELIFESHDVEVGWNGTYDGKQVQDGIYTWRLKFGQKNTSKVLQYTGHVNKLK